MKGEKRQMKGGKRHRKIMKGKERRINGGKLKTTL